MVRRFLLAACALVALIVAGCGGGSSSNSSSGGTTASNEPITLEVWDWGATDPATERRVDQAYMDAHPNVTIKRVHQPADAYFGTLMQATIAKHKGPDMMLGFNSPWVFDFVRGIRPVNDLITDQQRKDIVGWDGVTTGSGDTLAVPFDANGTLVYYNRALFRKAGLDPNSPPTTWDELMTACDKLNAAGIVPISGGFKDGGLMDWMGTLFSAQFQTDDELAKAASAPDWASPAIGRMVSLVQEAYKRKCFTPHAEAVNLFPDAVNNFKAGKAAIGLGLAGGDVYWKQFREDTDWGRENLGVALAPLAPGNVWNDQQRVNYGAGSAYFITKWSPHPREAYDYLMYLASPDVQAELFDGAGALPVNLKTTLNVTDPVAQQIIDWTKSNNPYVDQFALIGANVDTLYHKYVPDLLTGKKQWSDIQDEIVATDAKSPH